MQSRITKNAKGYGYKYTDLSEIHKLLEENNLSYYQFVLTEDGADYVYTVRISADGQEGKPIRGARVVLGALSNGKSNAAQDYGSALTYARRYSLLMAYGLATTDDDAASLTQQPQQKPQPQQKTAAKGKRETDISVEELDKKAQQGAAPAQNVASGKVRAAVLKNFTSLSPAGREKVAAHYGFECNDTGEIVNMTNEQADAYMADLQRKQAEKNGSESKNQ